MLHTGQKTSFAELCNCDFHPNLQYLFILFPVEKLLGLARDSLL